MAGAALRIASAGRAYPGEPVSGDGWAVAELPVVWRIAVLDGLGGVRSVAADGGRGLVVDIDGMARTEVVAELVRAGVGVDRVVPRRRLEDAFLALVSGGERT